MRSSSLLRFDLISRYAWLTQYCYQGSLGLNATNQCSMLPKTAWHAARWFKSEQPDWLRQEITRKVRRSTHTNKMVIGALISISQDLALRTKIVLLSTALELQRSHANLSWLKLLWMCMNWYSDWGMNSKYMGNERSNVWRIKSIWSLVLIEFLALAQLSWTIKQHINASMETWECSESCESGWGCITTLGSRVEYEPCLVRLNGAVLRVSPAHSNSPV